MIGGAVAQDGLKEDGYPPGPAILLLVSGEQAAPAKTDDGALVDGHL